MTEKPDNPSFSPNISPLSRVLADAATLYGTTVESNPASASVAPATGAISHDTPATVPVLSAGCGGPEEASSAPSRRPVPVSAALLTAAPTSAQPMAHDGT